LSDILMIKEYLKNSLSERRYVHSLNTADTAEMLAKLYDVDSHKAYLAGLIHDCTRELDLEAQQAMLKALGINIDDITYNTKELLHSHTADYIMKNQFKIIDEEITSAVRCHTTGKENMTALEKIVFLSDVVEPSRSFPGIDYIRQLSKVKLDKAVLEALDSSIRFLLGKRSLIHPDTLKARNYILKYCRD
jgi:predicted HD superfamily hydrolase involved in NAD metabolism